MCSARAAQFPRFAPLVKKTTINLDVFGARLSGIQFPASNRHRKPSPRRLVLGHEVRTQYSVKPAFSCGSHAVEDFHSHPSACMTTRFRGKNQVCLDWEVEVHRCLDLFGAWPLSRRSPRKPTSVEHMGRRNLHRRAIAMRLGVDGDGARCLHHLKATFGTRSSRDTRRFTRTCTAAHTRDEASESVYEVQPSPAAADVRWVGSGVSSKSSWRSSKPADLADVLRFALIVFEMDRGLVAAGTMETRISIQSSTCVPCLVGSSTSIFSQLLQYPSCSSNREKALVTDKERHRGCSKL